MRYYDTKLRCEVFEANDNTLDETDERISFFFNELPEGKQLEFTEDGIPFLIDAIVISKETIELQAKINEAKAYLVFTDWYCSRKVDSGKEIPEEVVSKRAEARELINQLEVNQ